MIQVLHEISVIMLIILQQVPNSDKIRLVTKYTEKEVAIIVTGENENEI